MAIVRSSVPAVLVMLCLCMGPSRADTIYSCADKDGAEVLQNMPCQPGSQLWVQPDAGAALVAPAPATASVTAPGIAPSASRAALPARTTRAARVSPATAASHATAATPVAAAKRDPDPMPNGTIGAVDPDADGPRPGMPTIASDSVASDGESQVALPGEPALGMTQQQVRSILGEPTAIAQEEVVEGKVVTWTYGDSKVLQFDATGRLAAK